MTLHSYITYCKALKIICKYGLAGHIFLPLSFCFVFIMSLLCNWPTVNVPSDSHTLEPVLFLKVGRLYGHLWGCLCLLCVHMHVHLCVVVHIHICAHMYGGQKSISDFISQESSTLYFWRQSLLLTWDSLFRQAWLTSKPPDSSAYTSPELGRVGTHQHAPESWLGTGDGMQTLLLLQQVLYLHPLPQSVSVR